MSQTKHDIILRISKFLNLIIITLPFAACWYGYYSNEIWGEPFYYWGDLVIIAVYFLLYSIFARVYDAMLISYHRVGEMVFFQALAFLVADGLIYAIICILSREFANLLPGLACIAVQIVFSSVWCAVNHKLYFVLFPAKPTAIIYEDQETIGTLIWEYGLGAKFKIVRKLQALDFIENPNLLENCTAVFCSGVRSHERNKVLKYCMEHDIECYVVPSIGDILMSGATEMNVFHMPLFRVSKAEPYPEYRFIKRLMDILLSAFLLLILSPLMIYTAIAIRLYDGGPAFYRQVRLTKNGRKFEILKFRSMCVDAEKDGVARLSTGDKDTRITPFGHLIRRFRIDELPQLFNVLKGDLSLVGPRPERPEIAEEYEKTLPEFRLRLQVKAGLTGYAQVYGKYNSTPYDKLAMDLIYISHADLFTDIKLLFATVKALFSKESTEGVEEGKTTAE